MTGGQEPAAGPQWTPEVQVSEELAVALIRAQFPGLAFSRLTLLATGWDNTVFGVDDRWVFRFPRREIALPGFHREIAVLPRLAPLLPLPIPDPRFIGRPTERYRWPFFGARMLPGTELADCGRPDSDRAAVAAQVGRFLRVLHGPRVARLPERANLPIDPMRRANARFRAGRARDVLARLAADGTWPGDDEVSRLLGQAEREPPDGYPASREDLVLCHGDLHLRHLLIGKDGTATGVIDWGDLCLADPAVDLAIAYLAFAGRARADLLTAYGRPMSPRQELAARTLALSLGAGLADYAAADGRPALLAEALAGLRRAVSRP